MLEKVKLSSYHDIFQRYRSFALKKNYIDVLLVGSIQDPGISDIDCILVLNEWSDIRKSILVLNPEFMSTLFTHGPFVCPANLLTSLFRYTTLRELQSRSSPISSLSCGSTSDQFITVFRQSCSIPHLILSIGKFPVGRHSLLLLNSVLHSLRDCSIFFQESVAFDNEVDMYAMDLRAARQVALDDPSGGYDIRILEFQALKLLGLAASRMAQWITDNFEFDSFSDLDPLLSFRRAIYGSTNCRLKSAIDITQWNDAKEFLENLRRGYFKYGALWRGASFPLHFPPELRFGYSIWLRRAIKRSAALYAGRPCGQLG
jgi:hypothetical protein